MSLLFAPLEKKPELLASLYLYAVLPGFSDLLKHCPLARKTLGNHTFSLRLQSGSLQADLYFSKGRCRFFRNPALRPQIVLRYLSHTHLNHQFNGEGFTLPVPSRGATRLGDLKAFSALAGLLQEGLLSSQNLIKRGLESSLARSIHIRLTLGCVMAAGAELINGETFSQSLFEASGDWLIDFSIASTDLTAWLERREGLCHWGRGAPPRTPDASLQFASESAALEALSGKTDTLAMVNLGNIRLRGHTPLLDKLEPVFARIDPYLKPQ
ncbi:MAG: hypothetical protein LAT58_01415 [Opitutales bacterium]|nr:hypothetical protein [Opitutales bacterium]